MKCQKCQELKKDLYGGFPEWWYPTTMGFPTRNDHFQVFWGYQHHLRKHPYNFRCKKSSGFGPPFAQTSSWSFRETAAMVQYAKHISTSGVSVNNLPLSSMETGWNGLTASVWPALIYLNGSTPRHLGCTQGFEAYLPGVSWLRSRVRSSNCLL